MTDASMRALGHLRDFSMLKWYVIPLLAIVLYIYSVEMRKARSSGNWDPILAGLALFGMDFFNETWNGWVLAISGRSAFWTAPRDTALRTMVAWNIEIMFMFAIAGIVFYYMCPDQPRAGDEEWAREGAGPAWQQRWKQPRWRQGDRKCGCKGDHPKEGPGHCDHLRGAGGDERVRVRGHGVEVLGTARASKGGPPGSAALDARHPRSRPLLAGSIPFSRRGPGASAFHGEGCTLQAP